MTVQAQILDLLHDLQCASASLILITHNMGIVAMSRTGSSCYAGRKVEGATLQSSSPDPRHPYAGR